MMFSCLRCGACCKDLIVDFNGWRIGLFLMAHEIGLFPINLVSPGWAVGTRGRSRPRLNVKSYQLNVKDCPYITPKNLCGIYERRPVICRGHPLTIHVNPATMNIRSASVDSKCPKCKEMPFGGGTLQVLGKCFSEDILRANGAMASYLKWMFKETAQQVWLYDVNLRQWREVTAEIVQQWR